MNCVHFQLPYGRGFLPVSIDEQHLSAVLTANPDVTSGEDAAAMIERALKEPIGTPTLQELARGKNNVVVIISDHTRPVPSKLILPPMLKAVRQGNPDASITLLVATGCHRATTVDELRAKLGDEIFEQEHICVHDCDDEENMVFLGMLPSGQPLRINRIAAEADLLLAEGFIEPHFFAGFSGGRKSVLPGISARETVVGNHCAAFIDDPNARTGILKDNPIHRDMIWAAGKAKLAFIVNVILNGDKQVVSAWAGDPFLAHEAGCQALSKHCRVNGPLSDIVITTNGGYPLDQNVYQAVKGMTAAEAVVRQGGVIIMLASASDGCGGEHFYRQIAQTDPETQLANFRSREAAQTEPDQWQTQIFLRVLLRAKIILISDCPDETVRAMRMIPARNVDEALKVARELLNDENASVCVIPDGVSVIVQQSIP